jgi:hypothetical protein
MDRNRLGAYVSSLPERAARAIAGLAGGVAREAADVLLPPRVRRSRLYGALVDSTLRFLVEQVGQMESPDTRGAAALPPDFLVRRTAGNVFEIAGIATFSASPVWVLAALSDLAGAGRELIGEMSGALVEEGLLQPGRTFETMDQLLDGLDAASGRLAEAVNTPPLDVATLREEWARFREEASRIPRAALPAAGNLAAQWRELRQEAAAQGRPVLELSSAIALSAVRQLPENARWLSKAARVCSRRTGEALGRGLLDHYRKSLAEIRETGYARYCLRELAPYLKGAARQFSAERQSLTERLLSRRFRR